MKDETKGGISICLGALFLVVGAGWIYKPLAFLVGGLLLLATGLLSALSIIVNEKKDDANDSSKSKA